MTSPLSPKRDLLAIEDVTVRERRVTIVRFMSNRISDTNEIEDIGSLLYGLVEEHGRTQLLLNFSNVQMIASYLLGKLLGLKKRIKTAEGRLVLCEITPTRNPVVYEAFEVCGLLKLFEMYDTEEEALRNF